MEQIDYKWILVELISSLKDKSTYLKTIDANDSNFNKSYYDGMVLINHLVMDEILSIAKRNELNLDDFGLDNYDPNEILEYTPLNWED